MKEKMRSFTVMRASTLAMMALFTAGAGAQLWCPPGAQWGCSIQGLGSHGFVGRTYVGDTLFEGLNAQHLRATYMIIQEWNLPEPDTSWNVVDEYTAIVDSTLLQWGSFFGNQAWDTLFRFDAQVGDHWYPPGTDDICDDPVDDFGRLLVISTDLVTIDAVPLRTWTVQYTDQDGLPSGSGIIFTERLGYSNGFFLSPACLIVEYSEELTCYSDNAIGYNNEQAPFGCASMLNVEAKPLWLRQTPFPNPGTDHFTVHLLNAPHAVELWDAWGRSVLSEGTNGGTAQISTAHLPSGAYFINITDADGTVQRSRWVKE